MPFTPWIHKATPEQIAAGETHEQAQESADKSYDYGVYAPPCVGCGEPVTDQDFYRHRYERHAGNEMVQPFGKPDAREALFLAHSVDELGRKVALWRAKHPGLRLRLAADGKRYEGRLVWVRYRVFDTKGRAAR